MFRYWGLSLSMEMDSSRTLLCLKQDHMLREKLKSGEGAPSICENKAFAILNESQAGKMEIIKKDGGEMLVAIALRQTVGCKKS